MKNKSQIFVLAFMGLMSAVAMSAQTADFGVWTDAGVEKKINKRWQIYGGIGMRTRDNSKAIDLWNVSLEAAYKPASFLRLTAGYNIFYDHHATKRTYHKEGTVSKITPSYWWPRHRFIAGITGYYSIGGLVFSLREMYQFTYRSNAADKRYDTDTGEWEEVKGKSQHLLRSHFQMSYRLRHTPFTPFGSVETFQGKGGLQKINYTFGTNLSITRQHALRIYYRYQDLKHNDSSPDIHVLGVGYTYKF